jgi:hypothetical protein
MDPTQKHVSRPKLDVIDVTQEPGSRTAEPVPCIVLVLIPQAQPRALDGLNEDTCAHIQEVHAVHGCDAEDGIGEAEGSGELRRA